MGQIKVKVSSVRNNNQKITNAASTTSGVKNNVRSIHGQVDAQIRARNNIDVRLQNVANLIETSESRMYNIGGVVSKGLSYYQSADQRVIQMKNQLLGIDNKQNYYSGTAIGLVGDSSGKQKIKKKDKKKDQKSPQTGEKKPWWATVASRMFLDFTGKAGVVGTIAHVVGDHTINGVNAKTMLKSAKSLVGEFGNMAKEAYKESPNVKKTLVGDWAVKYGKDTTVASRFSAELGDKIADFTGVNAKNVGDGIKVGTKWAGVIFDGAVEGIENYQEYQSKKGTAEEISVERAVGETVIETGVSVWLGILGGAGAAALLGATAPAVVVAAVGATTVWAADKIFEKFVGKDIGESVSDTIMDGIESVSNKLFCKQVDSTNITARWA